MGPDDATFFSTDLGSRDRHRLNTRGRTIDRVSAGGEKLAILFDNFEGSRQGSG